MAAHADFAAVLGVDQHILNDSLRQAYLNNSIGHQIALSTGLEGFLEYTFDLFSDAPEVVLAEEFHQGFIVTIRAWGEMTVSTAGPARGVEVTILMRIPHAITLNSRNELVFGLDPSNLTVTRFDVNVLQGEEFPDNIQNLHENTIFLDMMSDGVREHMSDLGDTLPTVDISFLDTFLVLPGGNDDYPLERYVTARTLNGVLNIGIDLVRGNYGTAGNPSQLYNINEGLSFTIATNPDIWLPVICTELLEGDEESGQVGIRQQVANNGATLDSFSLSMGSGHIHVALSASHSAGSIDTSFNIVPKLRRPAQYIDLGDDELGYPCVLHIPASDELWFDTENVDVDIDLAWWVIVIQVVVGIVTLGIGAMVFQVFRNMFQRNIEATLYQSSNLQFSLGDIDGKIERFEFHPDSKIIGLSISNEQPRALIHPSWKPPQPIAYTVIDVDERLLDRELRFRVRLPYTVHSEDPYLRIGWEIRRTDNNGILLTHDGQETEIAIPGLHTASDLTIRCRVYRILWDPPIELYQGNFTVYFRDRLDQSHPYVRWRHYVSVPEVTVDADGNQTIEGYRINFRHSKIHRTDFPERCRMVSKYSLARPARFRPPPWRPPEIEYLDALLYTRSELLNHRDELCDYCFFGGPASTTIRPLPDDS